MSASSLPKIIQQGGIRVTFDATAEVIYLDVHEGWVLEDVYQLNTTFIAWYDAAQHPVPTVITYHTQAMPADIVSSFTRSFDMPFFTHPNAGPAYIISPPPVGHGLLNMLGSINPRAALRFTIVNNLQEAHALIAR
jgi:hypothetical protein